MRKRFVIDFKRRLLVFRIFNEKNRLGFNLLVFPYRNVLGISSGKRKSCVFSDFEKKLTEYRIRKIKGIMIKENMALLSIFQSSKDKYHFISPQIYDWLTALRISQELGSEKNYLSISSVRQEFILRITKKGSKDEPNLVKTIENMDASDVLFSSSMMKFLKFYYGVTLKFINPKYYKDNLIVEKYRTTNL